MRLLVNGKYVLPGVGGTDTLPNDGSQAEQPTSEYYSGDPRGCHAFYLAHSDSYIALDGVTGYLHVPVGFTMGEIN